jgi:hypothetical protein
MLACNLNAIPADTRPRYNALVNRLRSAVENRTELPDGYTYTLDLKAMSLVDLAEWITIERNCCPFLTFHIDVSASASPQLTLRGPSGSKPILEAALALL